MEASPATRRRLSAGPGRPAKIPGTFRGRGGFTGRGPGRSPGGGLVGERTGGISGRASQDLRTLFEVGVVAGLTDAELVERFAAGGPAAEVAFEVLVDRHGPMVLR